jgi:hypothetical protein
MRLAEFERMVRRMADEVPAHFLDGVTEIAVSKRAVPHPTRAEIYTLGECIPVTEDGPGGIEAIQSRVVIYHGSFTALARLDDAFDWRQEAWETLTHELRHHVEWRAGRPDLEAFDRAAEQNFARHDGEPFDPLFFLDGDSPVDGVYEVDGDYFLDRVVRRAPVSVEFNWHGRLYQVPVPTGTTLPTYLYVTNGIAEPPPGDLTLVLRRKASLLDLFRETRLAELEVVATPICYLPG